MGNNNFNQGKRNYGLELLRILSMFLVLTIHYIGKSNLTSLVNNSIFNWYVYNFILAIALVANNCYVLISGYFLIHSKFKIRKVFSLILESWFYSLGITLILHSLGYYNFSTKNIIEMLFPLLTRRYWFLSFYIILYILSPFLNKWIKALTKKELEKLIIILLIVFSIFGGTILRSSYAINSEGSFSFIWFITLYIIASYIRLYGREYNKKYIFLGLLAAIIVTILNLLKTKFIILGSLGKFYQTTNFFIFIESLSLFIFFKDLNINNNFIKNLSTKIAPLTLAVYLIHQTPALDAILYKNILHTEICYHNNYALAITVVSIIIIFVIFLLIEYIRQIIFKAISKIISYTRIPNWLSNLYLRIDRILTISDDLS